VRAGKSVQEAPRFAADRARPFHVTAPGRHHSKFGADAGYGSYPTELFGTAADQCLLFPDSDRFADKSRMTRRVGSLKWLLPQTAVEYDGLFLYYPRRASSAPKLRAFIDVAKKTLKSIA
jgi:hypothetical protein